MTLTSLLELAPGPTGSRVEYVVGGQTLTPAAREQAARMLADDAMALRCGQSPALERWRAVRDGRTPEDTVSAGTVLTYAAIGFGSPHTPASANHLQGLVAELLWNRLIKERRRCSGDRALVKAHSVKPDPLEPGGDGLVVYRVGTAYVFRLWEIKKHDAERAVSATINRASKQLATRGNEYLAKLAGVGVSVGTSDTHAPRRPLAFRSITTAFPRFSAPGQAEGVVVALPDFPGFAIRVREIVWSGL